MHQPDTPEDGALVRRLRMARIRQWEIAIVSLLLAAVGVIFLKPDQIGAFAYYTIAGLMILNAIIALRQCILVFFPIETLLIGLRRIERDIARGKLDFEHLSIRNNDAFAYLAAGIDELITNLSAKTRAASERALVNSAMIQATPFSIFTVSKDATVYEIVRDQYSIVPLLGIEVGKRPSAENLGRENADRFLRGVKKSFSVFDFVWFDMQVGVHHLRGCVKRITDMMAVVEIGDLQQIDQSVGNQPGNTACEADFTHKQNALRRFAASIAHDAKNVFAAIGNLVEINKNSTDPSVLERIGIAEDAIRRGTQLMTELTAFAGETRYHLSCMPAKEGLIPLVDNTTTRALIPPNVQLIHNFSDKELPDVDLDPDQAWKVGFNLVRNAVEAMNGNDGHIWVKVEPCTMTNDIALSFRHSGTLRTGKGVLATVTDDGPGIAADMLDRIFEPYYSSKGNNRGVGLATVLSIVDAHSGGIAVKSSPGYGTTFYIYLPASRNTKEEISLVREVAPNGEILLVDDDPTILHTTQLVLRTLKIAAHPADCEHVAISKLRTLRTRLNAVIVDANINCVSSAGLVRFIHDEMPDLPVIVASGSPRESVDKLFDGVPFDRFLGKPYSIKELAATLEEVKG